MPYYNYIPFRAVLAAGRAAGLVLAVPLVLVAAGPLLVVTDTAASRRQCRPFVGRSAGGGRPPVVASIRRGPPAVGRWSLVAVGRPVGQPCHVCHKYVRIGGGTESRKRAAVAGGGVPVSVNISLRCLIAKFFIFFIFLSGDMEASS